MVVGDYTTQYELGLSTHQLSSMLCDKGLHSYVFFFSHVFGEVQAVLCAATIKNRIILDSRYSDINHHSWAFNHHNLMNLVQDVNNQT